MAPASVLLLRSVRHVQIVRLRCVTTICTIQDPATAVHLQMHLLLATQSAHIFTQIDRAFRFSVAAVMLVTLIDKGLCKGHDLDQPAEEPILANRSFELTFCPRILKRCWSGTIDTRSASLLDASLNQTCSTPAFYVSLPGPGVTES